MEKWALYNRGCIYGTLYISLTSGPRSENKSWSENINGDRFFADRIFFLKIENFH